MLTIAGILSYEHDKYNIWENFIILINVKMPTIVGILTFISMIKTTSESIQARKSLFFSTLVLISSWNELSMKNIL